MRASEINSIKVCIRDLLGQLDIPCKYERFCFDNFCVKEKQQVGKKERFFVQ